MSWADWRAAILPKVPATWNIHEALKDFDLDFFVCFASGSGIIGQSGQANYAAGNTFNDAFVQYRHSLGLHASVLDIGVVEDIGYVSENQHILESLRAAAFHLLSERDLLESLQLMMNRGEDINTGTPPTRTAPFCNKAQITLGMRTELPLADPGNRCSWKRDPRMAAYRDTGSQTAASNRTAIDEVLLRFMAAAGADPSRLRSAESIEFLADQISARVLGFLMVPDKELDPSVTLNDVGLDSLVAIELRNWWRQSLGSDVSVLELLNANVHQLGTMAAERLQLKLEERGVSSDARAQAKAEEEEGKVTGELYTLMKSL
jgi:aryl carrier-like protein